MKITKKDFINELESFKGKEQYLLSSFNLGITETLETLEDNMDYLEHISNDLRLVESITIKDNKFMINNSNYYWQGATNIYKIEKNWCIYYILHDTKNDNITIYENLI